jgi:hypothetical protein
MTTGNGLTLKDIPIKTINKIIPQLLRERNPPRHPCPFLLSMREIIRSAVLSKIKRPFNTPARAATASHHGFTDHGKLIMLSAPLINKERPTIVHIRATKKTCTLAEATGLCASSQFKILP